MAFRRSRLRRSQEVQDRQTRILADAVPVPALMDFAKGGTFSRPSVATLWNGSLLTRYGVDERRLVEEGAGLYMEGSRTNLILTSNDMTYTSGIAETLNDTVGPDGSSFVSTGQSVTPGGLAKGGWVAPGNPVAQSTPIVVSGFFKRLGEFGAEVTTIEGRSYVGVNGGPVVAAIEDVWERAFHVFDSGVSGSSYIRNYFKRTAADIWRAGITGGQLEEATFASMLIETFGTAATRAADRLSFEPSEVHPLFYSNSYEQRVYPGMTKAEFVAGSGGAYISVTGSRIVYMSGGTGNYELYVGGVIASITIPDWEADEEHRLRVDWARGEFRVVTPNYDITEVFTPPAPQAEATVHFGTTAAGTSPYFGKLYAPTYIEAVDEPGGFSLGFDQGFG